MNEKDFAELAAGAALHALSADDERRYRRALAEHPEWAAQDDTDAQTGALLADGVAPDKSAVLARPGLVAVYHALGMSVTVWTFREGRGGASPTVREEIAHFLNVLKVDAVFTDNPDRFPRD